MDSARQSRFNKMIRKLLLEYTEEEMRNYRAAMYKEEAAPKRSDTKSGFIARSNMVACWPTMSVAATDAQGKELALLRMELLSADTLFVLFDGTAASIWCREPKECLQMETEEGFQDICPETGVIKLDRYRKETSVAFAMRFMTCGDCAAFKPAGREEES